MFNFLNLFKSDLRFAFGFKGASKKDMVKRALLIALLCICFAVPLFLVFLILYLGVQLTATFGGLPEIINIVFFALQVMMFVLFLPSYVSTVFFSKDNELIASLPISKAAVFSSRILTVYIQMSVICLPISLITGIVVAVSAHAAGFVMGAAFWLGLLFAAITLPLISLTLITLISFPIMKIASLFRANSTLKSVIILVLYAVMFGLIYYGVISFQNSINNIAIGDDISANKAVVVMLETIKRIGGYIYPSLFIARAMTGVNGGASFGIYLAVIAAMLAIVLLLSKLFFTIRESGAINTAIAKKEKSVYKDKYKGTSIKLALMRKEFLSILRESQLALQTFAPIVLLPVLIVVYSVMFGRGSEQQAAMVDSIAFFIVVMGGGINTMASIAISREGEKFSLLKTLPVRTKDIVLSKLWLADILSICVVTICVISGAACKAFGPLNALFAFISGVALGLGVNCFSLSRDISNPNFRWNNYKELVKKSSKSLVPMLLSMSVGVVNMIIGIVCEIFSDNIGAQYVFWIKWGVTLALALIMLAALRVRRIDKMCLKFEKIEN